MGAVQVTAREPIVLRAVFAAGGVDYTWGDVTVAARMRGDWTAVADDARRGLAALAELHSRSVGIDAGQARSAAASFRYARGLLAGDELSAWLEAWDLTALDWTDWLGRALARERLAREADDLVAVHRPDPDEVETAAGVEAVCSGALESWARELAERAAVVLATGVRAEPLAGDDPPPARGILALAPSEWEAAIVKVAPLSFELDRALEASVDGAAIERELALHRLDWLTFDCRVLRFPEESMAREALLCLSQDGLTIDQVGAAARVAVEPMLVALEDLPEAHRAAFVGVRDGELVGPLADRGEHVVILVVRKRVPDSSDQEVTLRARKSARERALRREVVTRVQWHEQI